MGNAEDSRLARWDMEAARWPLMARRATAGGMVHT